jgi:hypothetical protein
MAATCSVRRSIPNVLASYAEHAAHLRLADKHHRGEWFGCTRDEARRAIHVSVEEAKGLARKGHPGVECALREHEFQQEALEAIALAERYRRDFIQYKSGAEGS